jgi:beta-glucuronidase
MRGIFLILTGLILIGVILLQDVRSASPGYYQIREVEGVPYLFENGMPYFTRFQDTDHEILDLSGIWKFQPDPEARGKAEAWYEPDYDDSGWFEHPIPGVWQAQKKEWVEYIGHGWYRRSFNVPEGLRARFNRLVLDGAGFQTRVWLNGREIGRHDGNYSRWSLDVSEHLRYGRDNQITVWISNILSYWGVPPHLSPGHRLVWWEFAGIARLVQIESSPHITVSKLAVQAQPLEKGKGHLELVSLIYNHGQGEARATVRADLESLSGQSMASSRSAELVIPGRALRVFRYEDELSGVLPWSPEKPENRYRLILNVAGPDGSERQGHEIGFKNFEVRGTRVYLNDKPYYIRGLNRHEDDLETGLYQSDARLNEDIAFLKDLHVNHIRGAHYPNDPRWLDILDRKGITFCEEIPLYQADGGSQAFYKRERNPLRPGKFQPLRQQKNPELIANAIQQLLETIERDRNHACLIMWSLGNENITYIPSSRRMYEAEIEAARRFDPDRVLTWALLSGPVVSPLLERTADLADIISINQYYGWYVGKVEGAGPLFDRFHRKYPTKPLLISEFGADASYGNHAEPGELVKFTEKYQVYILSETWRQMLDRPFIVGGMPWIFADFRCGWYGRMHPVFHMNEKGVLSHDRRKKLGYEALKQIYEGIEDNQY